MHSLIATSSGIGDTVAVVIVAVAVLWSVRDILKLKVGKAVVRIAIAAVVAAVISSPSTLDGFISGGRNVIKDTRHTASQLAHTAKSTSSAAASTSPTTTPRS